MARDVIAIGFLVVGCRGQVVTTAELHVPGTTTVHFTETGQPLRLWAEGKGKWTSDPKHTWMPVTYQLTFRQKGRTVRQLLCETIASTTHYCSMTWSIFDHHTGDCEVSLPCDVPPLAPGDVELEVKATPRAGVTEVDDISLLVRRK